MLLRWPLFQYLHRLSDKTVLIILFGGECMGKLEARIFRMKTKLLISIRIRGALDIDNHHVVEME